MVGERAGNRNRQIKIIISKLVICGLNLMDVSEKHFSAIFTISCLVSCCLCACVGVQTPAVQQTTNPRWLPRQDPDLAWSLAQIKPIHVRPLSAMLCCAVQCSAVRCCAVWCYLGISSSGLTRCSCFLPVCLPPPPFPSIPRSLPPSSSLSLSISPLSGCL